MVTSLRKRAEEKGHFHTPHGVAGLIIFALVYFILPLSIAIVFAHDYHEQHERRHSRVSNSSSGEGEYKDDPVVPNSPPARPRQSSSADKLFQQRRSMATTPDRSQSPPDAEDPDGDPIGAGEPIRLRQGPFAPSAFFKERLWPSGWGRPRSQHSSQSHSRGVRLSPELKDDNASRHSFQNHSASPSTATAGAPANETGFTVLNRNKNALVQQAQLQPDGARGVAEDRENSAWLYLRRNLNYMGDVDYMISKLRGTAGNNPGTAGAVAKSNNHARKVALRYPSLGVVVGRILAQVVIFVLVVFCAMSIALRGGDGPVGNSLLSVFVVWAFACYATMYWLAWNGRPRGSVLVVAISRLRGQQHEELDEPTEMDEHGAFSDVASHQAASTLGGATYASRAVYRRVHDSGSGARVDDDDDDNDRLEEEFGRRDVRDFRFRLYSSLILFSTQF